MRINHTHISQTTNVTSAHTQAPAPTPVTHTQAHMPTLNVPFTWGEDEYLAYNSKLDDKPCIRIDWRPKGHTSWGFYDNVRTLAGVSSLLKADGEQPTHEDSVRDDLGMLHDDMEPPTDTPEPPKPTAPTLKAETYVRVSLRGSRNKTVEERITRLEDFDLLDMMTFNPNVLGVYVTPCKAPKPTAPTSEPKPTVIEAPAQRDITSTHTIRAYCPPKGYKEPKATGRLWEITVRVEGRRKPITDRLFAKGRENAHKLGYGMAKGRGYKALNVIASPVA